MYKDGFVTSFATAQIMYAYLARKASGGLSDALRAKCICSPPSPAMLSIAQATAHLVLEHFPERHAAVVAALELQPQLQFRYLRGAMAAHMAYSRPSTGLQEVRSLCCCWTLSLSVAICEHLDPAPLKVIPELLVCICLTAYQVPHTHAYRPPRYA